MPSRSPAPRPWCRGVRLVVPEDDPLAFEVAAGEGARLLPEELDRLSRVDGLGRVDADQPDPLAARELERVAVDDAQDLGRPGKPDLVRRGLVLKR